MKGIVIKEIFIGDTSIRYDKAWFQADVAEHSTEESYVLNIYGMGHRHLLKNLKEVTVLSDDGKEANVSVSHDEYYDDGENMALWVNGIPQFK